MRSLPNGHISSFIGNGYASNFNLLLFTFKKTFWQMTQHNVGALVVVKPGQEKSLAGIVTERGSEQLSILTGI